MRDLYICFLKVARSEALNRIKYQLILMLKERIRSMYVFEFLKKLQFGLERLIIENFPYSIYWSVPIMLFLLFVISKRTDQVKTWRLPFWIYLWTIILYSFIGFPLFVFDDFIVLIWAQMFAGIFIGWLMYQYLKHKNK